jgi:hypothetical protein
LLLGLGGSAVALLIVFLVMRVLPILPTRLSADRP